MFLRMIPGDRGKAGSGWLTRPLLKRIARFAGGRIHQFLWHVRACHTRMRDLAARGDQKLLRAGSSSSGRFRAWANRSYPEGIRLLLRISTVRTTLADSSSNDDRPVKTAERRTKRAGAPGRTRGLGRFRENLPSAGDPAKRDRWAVSEKQPESEEARPVASGERTAKSGG